MDMETDPRLNDVLIFPVGGNRAIYAIVIRERSDARDYRRCTRCAQTFSYGAIAKHCVSDELMCARDCAND